MSLVNEKFIEQMELELEANQHKGDWKDWHPSKKEIIKELSYHLIKLEKALFLEDKSLIKEYSADVANLSEKIYTEFT